MTVHPVLGAIPLLLAAAPLPATDAAIVRAVLTAVSRSGGAQCVTRTTTLPPFAIERRLLAGSAPHAGVDAATRQARIRRRFRADAEAWRGESRPLDQAALKDVTDATGALLEHAATVPLEAGDILPALLARGQRPGGEDRGCTTVTLSPVSRWRDIAFVDVAMASGPLAGDGRRWALRFDGKRWRPFASGHLWSN